MVVLRDLPPDPNLEHFSKPPSLPLVSDQTFSYNKRAVPENERLVLALMEVAARKRQGLFFHLPSRDTWKKNVGDERMPDERLPPAAGVEMPSFVFMRYAWTTKDVEHYSAASQRARYLETSAILNPPPPYAPLYSVQYIFFAKCPAFHTDTPSLVTYAADAQYYVTTAADMAAIAGTNPADRSKLNTVPFLWDKEKLTDGGRRQDEFKTQYAAMRQGRAQGVERLYDRLLQTCQPDGASASLLGSELHDLVPRASPQSAAAVGLPLTDGKPADPASRKGETHQRRKRRLSL